MEQVTNEESTSMPQETISSTLQNSETKPSDHVPTELPASKGPRGTMGKPNNTRPNKQSDFNNKETTNNQQTTVNQSNTTWDLVQEWLIGIAGVVGVVIMIGATVIILSNFKIKRKPDVLNDIKV